MKILLASVGGSPEPIIKTIETQSPDKIIFFASKNSRTEVGEKIAPNLHHCKEKTIDYEIIVTQDESNLGECVKTLLTEVPMRMKNLGSDKDWPDIVDYTGGTKTMSAAVVWASSKFPCQFNYVSGTQRDKNGLGTVISGTEVHKTIQNPWNEIGYFEIVDAMTLFDFGQYANSAKLFAKIAEKVSDNIVKNDLNIIQKITEAYSQWDRFNHNKAISLFHENLNSFKQLARIKNPYYDIEAFAVKTEENFEFLKSLINSRELSRERIVDLLANALRRADFEEKYDDATARVYSAIEKIAKLQLKTKYDINSSNCKAEQIPETIREKYINSYTAADGKIKFGCVPAYHLLAELNDEIGLEFKNNPEIKKHLEARNDSILAHGSKPIDRNKFEALFNDALKLMNITRHELPLFPKFNPGKFRSEFTLTSNDVTIY